MRAYRSDPLAALLAAAWLVAGVAAPAQAHNVLRSSDPENGSTVPAPQQVSLTFDQPVQALGTVVEVEGPEGPLELDPVVVDGQTVVQALPERLATGDYTVLWRATSSDGHPIDGTLTFTATAATQAPAPTSPPATAPTTPTPPATPADPTPTDTPIGAVPAADEAGGSSGPLWLGLGALTGVVAGAAGWLLRRGRTPT